MKRQSHRYPALDSLRGESHPAVCAHKGAPLVWCTKAWGPRFKHEPRLEIAIILGASFESLVVAKIGIVSFTIGPYLSHL